MRTLVVATLLALGASAPGCSLFGDANSGIDGRTLASGTSFGLCMGYCRADLTVTPDRVATMRWRSWGGERPNVTRTRTLTEAEYDRLERAFDAERLRRADEVYGCPDCADGGAEYVEAQAGGATKRVTFEYGEEVAGLDALIVTMRDLRASFDSVAPAWD